MALTKDQLIKQWIQYLKSNQIAELQPDPAGKLIYIKQPTEEDLSLFLQRFFEDEDIKRSFSNARRAQSLRNKKSVPEGLNDTNPCWKGYHPVGTKVKDGKTVPNCVPKAEEDISEEFRERSVSIDEKFVDSVFQSIIRIQNFKEKQAAGEIQEKKKSLALDRLKQIISGMSAKQKSQLLYALKSSKITESVTENVDDNKIDIKSLIQRWKNNNYLRDINSLKAFLLKAGYSFKDVKNAIYSLFSDPYQEIDEPDNSPAIQTIVKISQDLDITDQLIEILEKEHGVNEGIIEYNQVKSLLETMSLKTLDTNLRAKERQSLGKNKKH